MKRATRRRPARGLLLAALAAVATMVHAAPARAAMPAPVAAVTAGDLGYPYPSAPDCDEQTGTNCVADQWGFVEGQCHSWVAYRLNELNAAELGGTFDVDYRMPAGDEWGNPSNWDTAAQDAGITINATPALGSVAWWAADGGHVAYVEAVNADGSVEISEMNSDYHNGFDFATLTPTTRWPDAFLHIADRPPVVSAPIAPGAPTTAHATQSAHTIVLTWKAPSNNGGSAITHYSVAMSPGSRTATTAGSSTRTTFTNVAAGSYTLRVRAQNAAGTGAWSSASNRVVVPASRSGYWMLGAGGAVYEFGDAVRYGDAGKPMVAMAARRDGLGYWTVDSRGRVHSFGTATAHGGSPLLRVGESVSTIAATPSGNGYWLFTNQGRAFRYGDAHVFGDMSNVHLNGPIIASAATATGKGYFMVGSDGGVFSFGDARFHGSTGAMKLNQPIVGISPTPDNRGYWLVASDGGVFAFGAPFRGSMGHVRLNRPVNGLVAFGNGYLMVASDGGIFNFSNQPFFGSLAGRPLPAAIVGISAFATNG
jgi:surface antigen